MELSLWNRFQMRSQVIALGAKKQAAFMLWHLAEPHPPSLLSPQGDRFEQFDFKNEALKMEPNACLSPWLVGKCYINPQKSNEGLRTLGTAWDLILLY